MRKAMVIGLIVLAMSLPVLGNSAGVTYVEKYKLHGFNLYGREYLHTGAAVNVRGFDIAAVSHADDAEADDFEYWDTFIGYDIGSLGPVTVRAGYDYLVLPTDTDAQELSLTLMLPGIVSPRYTVSHIEFDQADTGGQMHVMGFDTVLGDLGDPNAVTAVLSADFTYNDGVNPLAVVRVHDITHISAALVANVPAGDTIIHPSVYYQHNFNKSVGDERNDVWLGLSISRRF